MNSTINQPFEDFVKQNERRIHFHIHLLHIKDVHNEFYQDGLYALWNVYQTYQPDKGSINSYLNWKIRNRLIDALRKKDRQQKHEAPLSDEKIANQATVRDSEMDPYFWEAVRAQLTANQWKWVHYFIVLDLPIKKIAELENTTLDAVKNWGRQVRKKLKEEEFMKVAYGE